MDYLLLPEEQDEKSGTVLLNGTPLRVERMRAGCWLFELRVDTTSTVVPRQPELAHGYNGERSTVEVACNDTHVHIASEGGEVVFSRSDGSFEVREHGSQILRSLDEPIVFAAQPVMEYENVSSQYFAELLATNPPPLPEYPNKYETMKVRLRLHRTSGPILGLAGCSGEFDRGGYRFELYNTDRFPHIPDRTSLYQSWPIVFMRSADESGWYAIYWDNPSRSIIDCGDYDNSAVTFESAWGNARFLLFNGRSIGEVAHSLHRFVGAAAFPPPWAFGYHQSRWSYRSTNEVRNVVKEFRTHQVPLDVIHFDIDYMDSFKIFTTNPHSFGDLKECVADLEENGVRSVAIIDPGVKANEEYDVYRELMESGRYLRTTEGAPLHITAWPGRCILPDFSHVETREWWSARQRKWLSDNGIDGVWNDMNEPSNWDGGNAVVSKSVSADGPWKYRFNLYGYYMAEASSLGIPQSDPPNRPFVITRSGYPGVQRYSIVWHGDNCSWWQHLSLALETALAYSLCGAVFTGPDIPGFAGNAPADLAVRFFQLGAFLPFFRGHSAVFAEPKEPYRFNGEARRAIVEAIRLRYSLMREWYTGLERCCREGYPSMAPVLREDASVVADQYLLFDKFLVAPVLQRSQRERVVYLPPGRWYPLGNPSTVLHGGESHLYPVTLESIPVFVREGAVVVRNEPQRNVPDTLAAAERTEVYPDGEGRAVGYWFDDLTGTAKRRRLEASGEEVSIEELPVV